MILKINEGDTETLLYEGDTAILIDIMYYLVSLDIKANMLTSTETKWIRKQYNTEENRHREYFYRKEYEAHANAQEL